MTIVQKKSILDLFYLDKLHLAAQDDEPLQLSLIRQVIFQTKIIQLERMEKATNSMMMQVLETLANQKKREYEINV